MVSTKKITIVLPGAIHEDLTQWADEEKRPLANLTAYLVEQSLRAKYPSKYPPRTRVESSLPMDDLDQIKKFITLLLGDRERNGVSFVLLGQALDMDPEKLHELYQLVRECRKEHANR